jgi:hypothetical protein
MTTCPHCGAGNSPGVVYCAHCHLNVHNRGVPPRIAPEPPRPLTEEERVLVDKKVRAQILLAICVGIIAVAVVVVARAFLSLPNSHTPESGFAGMIFLGACVIYGPLLLIPVIGIVFAVKWKRAAEARLHQLRKLGATTT